MSQRNLLNQSNEATGSPTLEDIHKSKRNLPISKINLSAVNRIDQISSRGGGGMGPTPEIETPEFVSLRIKTPTAQLGRPTEKIDLNFPKLSSRKTPRSSRMENFISLNSNTSSPPLISPQQFIGRASTSIGMLNDNRDWLSEEVRIDNSLSELTKYENYKFQRWNRNLEATPVMGEHIPPDNVSMRIDNDEEISPFITEFGMRNRQIQRRTPLGRRTPIIEEDSAESIIKNKQARNRTFLNNRTSTLAESKNQRPSTSFEIYKKQLLDAEEKFDALDTNSWIEFGMTSTSSFLKKIQTLDVKKSSMKEIEDDLKRKIKEFKENANNKDLQNHIQDIKFQKLKRRKEMQKVYKKDLISENKSIAASLTKEAKDEQRNLFSRQRDIRSKQAREHKIHNLLEKKTRTEDMIKEREIREETRNQQLKNISLFSSWKTIVTIINSLYIIKEKIKVSYEEREKKKESIDEVTPVLDVQDADYQKKRIYFNLLFREKYQGNLERIKELIGTGVRRWREQKKYESIQLISKFLTDLAETFRIPLAVSKFKNAVIKVQRAYRGYLQMKSSQRLLHFLQLEKFVQKRVERIEREIGKLYSGKKGAKPQEVNSQTLNKMMSSATLGVQNSKILFDLVAQKEEVKKIPKELKEEVVNRYYNERRSEHFRKLRVFEKETMSMKKSSVFSDFRPKQNFILSKNELQSLFDECYRRTREDIQRRERSHLGGIKSESKAKLEPKKSTAQLFKLARTATRIAVGFKNIPSPSPTLTTNQDDGDDISAAQNGMNE